jgi:putative pyruvate formate lyase activating enzyme
MGYEPRVSSWSLHHGEEPPISGSGGSGTIFLSGCPMHCAFCQNYPISQLRHGQDMGVEELGEKMLELQRKGAHNINFVTPTHFAPQIVEALHIAADRGLRLPIVYNSSGYDDLHTLRLLDGIVDIYLPDMKYSDDAHAKLYSGATDYVSVNRRAVAEMFRQVGGLVLDSEGIATRGLIVRHLVLPGGISGTAEVLEYIAGLSTSIGISLMSQYFPAHRAEEYGELQRKLTQQEYEQALEALDRCSFANGWIQPLD